MLRLEASERKYSLLCIALYKWMLLKQVACAWDNQGR